VLTVNRCERRKHPKIRRSKSGLRGDDDAFRLDSYQVTVTVQKRPQSVQDVPISDDLAVLRDLEHYKVENLRGPVASHAQFVGVVLQSRQSYLGDPRASNTFSQIGVNKPVAVVGRRRVHSAQYRGQLRTV